MKKRAAVLFVCILSVSIISQAAIVEYTETFSVEGNTAGWTAVLGSPAISAYAYAFDYDDGDPSQYLAYSAGMAQTGDGVYNDGGLKIKPQDSTVENESIGYTLSGTLDVGETVTFSGSMINTRSSSAVGWYAQIWNLTDDVLLAQSDLYSLVGYADSAYVPVDFSVQYTGDADDAGDTIQIRILERCASTVCNPALDNVAVTSVTAVVAESDVAIYEMEQTPVAGTDAVFDSRGTTVGTLINVDTLPTVVSGAASHTGNAWDFSGSSASIEIASNEFLQRLGNIYTTEGFSVAFWFSFVSTGLSERPRPFGMQDLIDCYITGMDTASPQFKMVLGTGTAVLANVTLDGTWHHCAYTIDFAESSHNITVYMDGVSQGTASYDFTSSFGGTGNFLIGARGTSYNYGLEPWQGSLDDFVIADYAMSETEVAQIKNSGAIQLFPAVPETATISLITVDGAPTVSAAGLCGASTVTNILQTTTNLVSGVWTDLYSVTSAAETSWPLSAGSSQEFFRIQTVY